MTSTPATTTTDAKAGLPQLSGGLLWAYRALWCTLAIAALTVFSSSFFHPVNQPAIFAIRLVKGIVVIAVSAILLLRRHRDPVAGRYQLKDRDAQITMATEVAASIASAARKQP